MRKNHFALLLAFVFALSLASPASSICTAAIPSQLEVESCKGKTVRLHSPFQKRPILRQKSLWKKADCLSKETTRGSCGKNRKWQLTKDYTYRI